MYACKICGASAALENAALKKYCDCQCGVTMDMGSAKLVNFSRMKEKFSAKENLAALINFIVERVNQIRGEAKCNRPD